MVRLDARILKTRPDSGLVLRIWAQFAVLMHRYASAQRNYDPGNGPAPHPDRQSAAPAGAGEGGQRAGFRQKAADLYLYPKPYLNLDKPCLNLDKPCLNLDNSS